MNEIKRNERKRTNTTGFFPVVAKKCTNHVFTYINYSGKKRKKWIEINRNE